MSSVNGINRNYNNTMRLVGLATGLDTDTIVEQLMFSEKQPLYKLQRQKQLAEWKQEAYREFINSLRSFKEQFFDITKRTSYLLSETAFKVFKVSSSAEEYVTARGITSAQAGSHTVVVKELATAARADGIENISKPITSGAITDINFQNKTITVTLDGVTREIELQGEGETFSGLEDFAQKLTERLGEAFGTVVDKDGNKISKIRVDVYEIAGSDQTEGSQQKKGIKFTTAEGVSRLTLASGSEKDGLSALGIVSGASNRISTGSTLANLAEKLDGLSFNDEDTVSFTINGKIFTFSKSDTLQKVMNTVNNDSDAKVTLSYDEASDRFIMTAKQTGAGNNIEFYDNKNGGTFLSALGLSMDNITCGKDAVAVIDKVTVVRSSNTFTVNGVEYTLKKVHEGESPATITIEQDVDTVYNSIKSFVDEYNKLVDMFNTKLSEKYDRNYQPLTDDEKEEMTEKEIEKWEKQAKTGLLRNDSILSQIQHSMRMALMDAVEGVGLSLSAIGISSTSYLDKGRLTIDEDKGRLTIDEDKLKAALREKPDQVRELFIKTSDSVPSYDRDLSSDQRNVRYREEGVLHRISDILNDYISTYRNKDGLKGILLEKAGMEGDLSQFNSSLSKEISDYEERISEMYTRLAQKQEAYYDKFTALETYMSQMNSQMNYLLSSLGLYQQ